MPRHLARRRPGRQFAGIPQARALPQVLPAVSGGIGRVRGRAGGARAACTAAGVLSTICPIWPRRRSRRSIPCSAPRAWISAGSKSITGSDSASSATSTRRGRCPSALPTTWRRRSARRSTSRRPGGGYVLASDHSLHDGIPLANIRTMFRVGREYGGRCYASPSAGAN